MRWMSRSFRVCPKGTPPSFLNARHRGFAALAVEAATGHWVDVQAFQRRAFIPQKPFLFKHETASPTHGLPAAKKWFSKDDVCDDGLVTPASFSPYLASFHEWPFPYELMIPSGTSHGTIASFRDWLSSHRGAMDQALGDMLQSALVESSARQRFFQLSAPLKLLIRALEFNKDQASKMHAPVQLYIAQSSLAELPAALRDDVPPPELVRKAGRGDVYSSSIWLGTQPTYTPLHRDPNPNIFCQLCSSKTVRLFPPAQGERLFFDVQSQIKQHGSSRIRTTEMMEGEEREVLHDAVWQSDMWPGAELYEVELSVGDALFIPKGWWHSVKSEGSEGKLNVSANWWFR